MTLRMLFTHTGGLQGMEEELAPWTPDYSWTVESEAALRVAPEISPGARLSYSDVDYVLLAMVVERLTDRPFPGSLSRARARSTRYGRVSRRGDTAAAGVDRRRARSAHRHPARMAQLGVLSIPLPAGKQAGHDCRRRAGARARLCGSAGRLPELGDARGGDARSERRTGRRAQCARRATGIRIVPLGIGAGAAARAQPNFAPAEAGPESFGHGGSSGCVTWADPAAGVAWSILGTRHIANWWGDPVLGEIGAEVLAVAGRGGDSGWLMADG